MSFYVTLPSTASHLLNPDNRPGKYTTRLARPLDLSGSWEVGLAEILFPPKRLALTETAEIHITRRVKSKSTVPKHNSVKVSDSLEEQQYFHGRRMEEGNEYSLIK